MFGFLKRKVEKKVTTQVVGAILRHGLTVIGATGLASDNQIEQISGALTVLIMVGWSIFQKYQADKAKQA